MKVQLVAKTEFLPPDDCGGWETDASGGAALIEFAGRECYQSWSKPNPETATNHGYITKSILSHAHFSVLEHATCTFRFTGIPRSLTHEFVRHRHFSYSELSQRYVNMDNAVVLEPPVLRDIVGEDAQLVKDIFRDLRTDSGAMYKEIVELLESRNVTGKRARQAARAVCPEATETRIVVTGNLRAWRHFLNLRASIHADEAIRELAIETLRMLMSEYPAVFSDYEIKTLSTGETVAKGQYHDVS